MALHSAGDLIHWHPHIHAQSLLGGIDPQGDFHQLIDIDTVFLQYLFEENVFAFLLKRDLLSEEDIASMRTWQHSGFNVFSGDPIAHADTDAALFISRYLKKSPVSLSRLKLCHDNVKPLVHISKSTDDDVQERTLSPLDFLAELCQHIPDKWEQTVRFFGQYSARARGAKRKSERLEQADSVTALSEIEPLLKPSREWATWIKKVYQVDPLTCEKCGSTMRIKSFLFNQQQIIRISKHHGVAAWKAPPPLTRTLRNVA